MKSADKAAAGPFPRPRGPGRTPVRPLPVLAALLLFHAGSIRTAAATSIVGVRTPEAAVIAADSLLTIRGGDKPVTGRACKIFPAGKYFFTLTGFYKDPDRHFDIAASLPAWLDQRLLLAAAADGARDRIEAAVRTELLRLQAEAPGEFARQFPGGERRVLRILYAGYENGTPVTLLQTYLYTLTPEGDVVVRADSIACPGDCNASAANFYFLTDRKAIDEYLKNGGRTKRTPEETAGMFVELVIKSRAPDTGPPVDLLRIDKDGAAWIARKAECPDIESTPREPAHGKAAKPD